jgi:hypothetical protein
MFEDEDVLHDDTPRFSAVYHSLMQQQQQQQKKSAVPRHSTHTAPIDIPVPQSKPYLAKIKPVDASAEVPHLARAVSRLIVTPAAVRHPVVHAPSTPVVKNIVHAPSTPVVKKEPVYVPDITPTLSSNRRWMTQDATDDELPIPDLPPADLQSKHDAANDLEAATYRLRTARRLKARLQHTRTRKPRQRLEIEQEMLLVDEIIAEGRLLVTELTPVGLLNTDAFHAEMAGRMPLEELDTLLAHPTVRSALQSFPHEQQRPVKPAFKVNAR